MLEEWGLDRAPYQRRLECPDDRGVEVFSPIDEAPLGRIAEATDEEVGAAARGAAAAFPAWAALGAEGRLPYLLRFAEEIGARADAFASVEALDAGILESRMRHGIVPRAQLNIRHFAEAALTLQDRVLETAQARPSGAPRPCGGLRHHHPLEFATHAQHLEAWAGAGGGEHLHPKGAGVGALFSALVAQAAEAIAFPGVLNLLQGYGGWDRCSPHRSTRARAHFLHRLHPPQGGPSAPPPWGGSCPVA